jgi:hypothetical protein
MELLRQVEAMNAQARREDKAEAERRHQDNVTATKRASRMAWISAGVAILCAVIATLPFYLTPK